MGKTKNKRHKMKKSCPTGLPSVRDIEKEEEMLGTGDDGDVDKGNDSQTIQSIIDKLQGVNVEEKECGCHSLSCLIDNPETLALVVKHDVIKMVAPLLVDPSCVVRHAAAGALRNLSVAGGHEMCDLMVDHDVMTPLVVLMKQYQSGWVPAKNTENKLDTKAEILVEAIHLLWNLCESNSLALTVFNQEKLIYIVYQFLNRDIYGIRLAIVAAQCLHTVSEENEDAIEMLSQPNRSEYLEKLIQQQQQQDNDSFLLRILAAGIFLNTKNGRLIGCVSRIVSCVMDVLSQALAVNTNPMIEVLTQRLNSTEFKGKDAEGEGFEMEDNELISINKDVVSVFTAQVVALEILTNICCSEDVIEDWEDLDCSDASDEPLDGETMECDEITTDKFPMMVSSEIQEAIISHSFVAKIIEKIIPLNDDIAVKLYKNTATGLPLLKRLTTLYCRALLCLHNLIPCLDIEEIGGPSNLYSTWINIAKLAFKHTYVCPQNASNSIYCDSTEHVEFLEAVTSALRAIVQKLIQVKTFQFEQLSWTDIQMLCELAETCSEANVRNNIINMVGSIGCVLAKSECSGGLVIIKNIGIFLLELCGRDTQLIVMAEALDAIFDVFGEESTDAVAQEINIVERLKQILSILRNKINTQKKSLGIHLPVVTTARTNLVRFIKYKNEQKCSNGHH